MGYMEDKIFEKNTSSVPKKSGAPYIYVEDLDMITKLESEI
jgi:hypothetical protein